MVRCNAMFRRTHRLRSATASRLSALVCLLYAVCCMLICGCGGADYEAVPVSGRIALDGKPLPDAHVSFQPLALGNPGPGSFAITDEQGRFTLRTIEPEMDGAVVGKHVVRITTAHHSEDPTDDAAGPIDDLVPDRYRDGSLRFEVPPNGTDQANFDLTSDWRAP